MSLMAGNPEPSYDTDLQDVYDTGYRDGFDAGRKMERDEIALRLAADAADAVQVVTLHGLPVGHTSWRAYKAAWEEREREQSGHDHDQSTQA